MINIIITIGLSGVCPLLDIASPKEHHMAQNSLYGHHHIALSLMQQNVVEETEIYSRTFMVFQRMLKCRIRIRFDVAMYITRIDFNRA